MIGISTQIFDLQGARLFQNELNSAVLSNAAGARRVSRTATLDGGAVLYDTGFSAGDKTIDVTEKNASQAAIEWAEYIVSTYSTVTVTTKDGAYTGAPQEYYLDTYGVLHIIILPTEEA
jgi:hypothetical protein